MPQMQPRELYLDRRHTFIEIRRLHDKKRF